MKKGNRQIVIKTIIAFVVMPIFGEATKGIGSKRFDINFGEENPYKPKISDDALKATQKARKEAEKHLNKIVKDSKGKLSESNFWIKEVRLNTSVSHKIHTRGEQLINIAEKKRSKRLTEKMAQASDV